MTQRSSADLARNFARLAVQSGKGIAHTHLSLVKFRSVISGGFPYEAFNPRGMLQPSGILKLTDRARISGFWANDPPLIDMGRLKLLIYMASASLHIQPEVYDLDLDKHPITIDVELGYVGKTSLKLRNEIYFPGCERPLVTGDMQCVLVDPDTKRPSPPPQWWQDKFHPCVDPSGKPLFFDKSAVAHDMEVGRDEVQVRPSDLDPYIHVSSSQYINLMMDAYTKWHIQQYGFISNGDPFRNLKSMVQSFKGEATVGDVLNIVLYQLESDLFHFHIIKDGAVIHECVAEFYPLLPRDTS